MKQITCEHCGCAIHLDSDKVCPNCKAPFSDNKEYKAIKEMESKNADVDYKEREFNLERKKQTVKDMKKTNAVAVIVIFFVIVVFIIAFTTSLSVFKDIQHTMDDEFKNNETEKIIIKEEEKPKTVEFNEKAEMKKFDIICDEVREYKYEWHEDEHEKAGTKYYAFHLVIKNKTDEMMATRNFKLIYTDEKGNEGISAKEIQFPNQVEKALQLQTYVDSNLSISGNIFFELPKNIKTAQIQYENVKINVTLK